MLPSITSTYSRVFKLFVKSFLAVLPFSVIYSISDVLLFKLLSYTNEISIECLLYITYITISTLLFIYILCCLDRKLHNIKLNYVDIVLTGLKRFFPVLGSYVLIAMPLVLMAITLNFVGGLIETLQVTELHEIELARIVMIGALILFVTGSIAWLLFCLYFYESTVFIALKNENPVEGLKHSWQLTKGYWQTTFGLFFIMIFIAAVLEAFFYWAIGDLASAVLAIFAFPLMGSLIIVHYDQLMNIHNSSKR